VAASEARGAGRAFPIDSENYVIEAFQRINRNIEWDETNFLVDLAGLYANCDNTGRGGQFVNVEKRRPDGSDIGGYVDDTYGDSNDYNRYIQSIIDSWTRDFGSGIYNQIQFADRFGCSVRPGCSNRLVVACLFSPSRGPNDGPSDIDVGKLARAFTKEQYIVAEKTTGQVWDSSEELANQSGQEVSCFMLLSESMRFPKAQSYAKLRGYTVQMLYGSSPNVGATEPAMVKVLQSMKHMSNVDKVGCSLVPDCVVGGEMYVVVGCLFKFN
jgi:hypothetical protein